MVEYEFCLILEKKKEVYRLHAPNPTVANQRFISYLFGHGIMTRQNISKPKYSFRTPKDWEVKMLGVVEHKPNPQNTAPDKFRAKLNKDIQDQLQQKFNNRRRDLASVLSDKDSGDAYQL